MTKTIEAIRIMIARFKKDLIAIMVIVLMFFSLNMA